MEPLAPGYTAGRTWFDNDQLVDQLADEIIKHGGDIHYQTAAADLQLQDGKVTTVEAASPNGRLNIESDAVVLATGGYESSPEKRASYYGPGFDDMKVRGSGYNTGEALEMALENGAVAAGQWSGAHMAIIDANAPDTGGGANRVDDYQYGLILNTDGKRFVDEGEDARAHTYAKFGREIFQQPAHQAFIIFDEYKQQHARATGPSDPVVAATLPALFESIAIDTDQALQTVREFNDACDPGEFDPNQLDGNAASVSCKVQLGVPCH